MPAGVQHRLTERLAREQIVAEIDRVECREALAVGGQPALGRHVLAILLLRPVLWDDEFRLQRDDPVIPHLAFHRLRRRNLGQLRPGATSVAASMAW